MITSSAHTLNISLIATSINPVGKWCKKRDENTMFIELSAKGSRNASDWIV
jgi:hypothetical protein